MGARAACRGSFRLNGGLPPIATLPIETTGGDRNEQTLVSKAEWQRDLARLERASATEAHNRAQRATSVDLKRRYLMSADLHAEASKLYEQLAVVFDRLHAIEPS